MMNINNFNLDDSYKFRYMFAIVYFAILIVIFYILVLTIFVILFHL